MNGTLAKATVRYRPAAPAARRRCGNCVMFRPGSPGRCTLVRGLIDVRGVCDHWARRR